MSRKNLVAGVIAVVFAALSIVAVGAAMGGGSRVGAETACEGFIGDELRSPGSAEFTHTDTVEDDTQPGVWIVSGYVDSENGFGAMLRSDYICTVESTDGGWVELSVAVI